MAEEDDSTDKSQKTEDPTPRRLEEARKRGQVVYSREVNNWVVLFTATMITALALPHIMSDIENTMGNLIGQSYDVPGDPAGLLHALRAVALRAAE
ncbi:MAG: EscU/YscU/HrcU family type III secretion system export apparatus switch protein, partial [Alphaproteobacteria bacterium]|nr:EscU/YscU/HrcU family type III secretion system export apparatus switch protein [Alphaproteobacteria bacterium]